MQIRCVSLCFLGGKKTLGTIKNGDMKNSQPMRCCGGQSNQNYPNFGHKPSLVSRCFSGAMTIQT